MKRPFILLLGGVGELSAQVTFRSPGERREGAAELADLLGHMLSQRYSPLTQITPQNVKNLEPQWVFQARSLEKFEATPLVVDGIMYTVQAPNDVVALDAGHGPRLLDLSVCAVAGVASLLRARESRPRRSSGDTLFMGTIDAHLIAIDAKNGTSAVELRRWRNPKPAMPSRMRRWWSRTR